MRKLEFGDYPRLVDIPNQVFVPDRRLATHGRCFLDGVDITDEEVIYASEASGEVRCNALKDGKPFIDHVTLGVALAPPRFGDVDIYLQDEEPA